MRRAKRSDAQQDVAELLRTAKNALGLSLTFLSRLDGQVQHLEVVESSIPFIHDGQTQPQATSFCQAILDGTLPPVIPDVAALPAARRLPAARFPRIRSFVSVPVTFSDGTVYGTFCAAGFTADPDLTMRDRAMMEVLAHAAATIIEPGVQQARRENEIRRRLEPMLNGGGPDIVVQPIVSLADGQVVGVEALSRFPPTWEQRPDEVFAAAASIGLGTELELQALRAASRALAASPGYLAINLSPATVMSSRCRQLLADLPGPRVVVELSEHDPVHDYDELAAALRPLRAAGVRLAIDDVGAGYSSLRHIILTTPDIIKLDRTIVAGLAHDHVLATLVRSLADFGHASGASVVAEGVEGADDARAAHHAGVDHGQGWYFGRPEPPQAHGPGVRSTMPARGT